jgi:hypothetical protein
MRASFKTKEERDKYLKTLERIEAIHIKLEDYPKIPKYTVEYNPKKWEDK